MKKKYFSAFLTFSTFSFFLVIRLCSSTVLSYVTRRRFGHCCVTRRDRLPPSPSLRGHLLFVSAKATQALPRRASRRKQPNATAITSRVTMRAAAGAEPEFLDHPVTHIEGRSFEYECTNGGSSCGFGLCSRVKWRYSYSAGFGICTKAERTKRSALSRSDLRLERRRVLDKRRGDNSGLWV